MYKQAVPKVQAVHSDKYTMALAPAARLQVATQPLEPVRCCDSIHPLEHRHRLAYGGVEIDLRSPPKRMKEAIDAVTRDWDRNDGIRLSVSDSIVKWIPQLMCARQVILSVRRVIA